MLLERSVNYFYQYYYFWNVFCFRLEWNKIVWDGIGEDGATALADVLQLTKNFTILK